LDDDVPADLSPARKLSVDYYVIDNDVGFVDKRRGRRGVALFLIVWLCGWTVGCALLIHGVVVQGEQKMLLFGIPFWVSWLFVAALVLYMLFGRTDFALTSRGAFYVNRLFVPLAQRHVPLEEILRFQRSSQAPPSRSGSANYGIELVTLGKSIRLAPGIPADERDWLCRELNRHLEQLRKSAGIKPPARASAADADGQTYPKWRRKAGAGEVLAVRAEAVTPPSDCDWRLREGFALEFRQRGRFQPLGLAGALFVCLFWNGIVSVFLYALFVEGQPPGLQWFVVFLFLLPFEAIGLLLIAAVILTILEPLRRSTWRFTENSLEYDWHYLGIGKTWRYPVGELNRIELRRGKHPKNKAVRPTKNSADSELNTFTLALVDQHNEQVAEMSGFTEGEARWIADCVLRERPLWFR
jgi:hypothetical protein